MQYKKILACLAASATLVSCSNEQSEELTKNSDGEIVVKFWHASGGAAGEVLGNIIEDFNKENEGEIEVQASYQGDYNDTISKFISSVQTGGLPVLLQANELQTAYLRDSGLVTPAADFAEKDPDYSFDQLLPIVSQYYTLDDKVYSMPAMVSQPAMYVNNDLLAEAGVKIEDIDSVDAFLDAVEKVHAETGVAGLTFYHNGWWNEQFAALLGNQFCSPDNGNGEQPADAFNLTEENYVNTWARMGELFASGAIHNPGEDSAAASGAFQSGRVAFQLNSSSGYGDIANADLPFDWSIESMPTSTEDAGAVPGGNSLWIIDEGNSDELQQAAWEFMKYIGSDEIQKKIFIESGYLPTTEGAASSLGETTPQQDSLLEQLENTKVSPVTAGCKSGAMNVARKSYGAAISEIANGKDAAAALEKAQTAANNAIETYNERAKYTKDDE